MPGVMTDRRYSIQLCCVLSIEYKTMTMLTQMPLHEVRYSKAVDRLMDVSMRSSPMCLEVGVITENVDALETNGVPAQQPNRQPCSVNIARMFLARAILHMS